jgi:hypothetical protein
MWSYMYMRDWSHAHLHTRSNLARPRLPNQPPTGSFGGYVPCRDKAGMFHPLGSPSASAWTGPVKIGAQTMPYPYHQITANTQEYWWRKGDDGHACSGPCVTVAPMLAADAPAAVPAATRPHRRTTQHIVISKPHCRLAASQRRQCVGVCATSSLAAQASQGTSVAVIGGGIGGLVVSGLLARQGLQVTLLEQNAQVTDQPRVS